MAGQPAERHHREGKLAETAPKRPLALTIGAAAATLLVILGVLSGPSIVSCFNSSDGMGQCLRGKMADVGLVPAAPPVATAEAEQPAAEATAAAVEEAVPDEPALDVTPPADAVADVADVDGVVAATFGLLRAEPDGSVVIAGSGTPGSKVEVFANGELLGSVEVEPSGDWVFVPDAPLSPGGLEITLGEEGKDGTAPDSFIVVIDEDKTSQPLVVASKPGEASEVLQGLTAPTQVATAPVADTPAVPSGTPAPAAPAAEPAVPEEPSTDVASAPETAAPAAERGAPASAPSAQPAPAAAPSAPAPATPAPAPTATAAAPATPVPAEQPAEPAPADEATAVPSAVPAQPAAPSQAAPAVPATPATPATSAPAVADAPPSIDAIEIENDRTFFAGAGPDGGIIRLYVDDTVVADTTVEGGRWLIEAGDVLDKPSQRVRADLLTPGAADVVARAEVDFVVDMPAGDAPIAVAEAPEPAAPAAPAPAAPTAQPSLETPATPAAPPAEPVADTPAQSAPAPAAPAATPAPPATPAQPAAPAAPAQPAPSTPPPSTPPVATPSEPAPAAQAPAAIPAPAVEPTAVAEATTDAEPAVPTMVAVSLGDPEAQRFASGKAIIRRGDNLWTIARRVYGEGLRYTTIYQANTGQIRDPDRIYPGQVFDLPEDAAAQ
ncbi:Nucleoid-associated protein YgaU, contains BON and LysM domains [Devosia lucknowensis]|uniref:Nucleoid-associated protein YgaU, contains BON and LysM domains n=1 Tax=Devosia lucknowensis TaxID=1096929 RepID=A0A1Y6EFX8_9HYPH|nr:LysM peptidoglycan-binding domain-containing protein [Devosia lucknowensis]SMQ61504.1 Nucleoid-associated protein YgaU, contains BON and LysM domains [Devosia lucknowensis]